MMEEEISETEHIEEGLEKKGKYKRGGIDKCLDARFWNRYKKNFLEGKEYRLSTEKLLQEMQIYRKIGPGGWARNCIKRSRERSHQKWKNLNIKMRQWTLETGVSSKILLTFYLEGNIQTIKQARSYTRFALLLSNEAQESGYSLSESIKHKIFTEQKKHETNKVKDAGWKQAKRDKENEDRREEISRIQEWLEAGMGEEEKEGKLDE